MSKTIDLQPFTEYHLTAVIHMLQYIKSHPGHLDKVIEVLDNTVVQLQETSSYDLDTMTLKNGEVCISLDHSHSKDCYHGSDLYFCTPPYTKLILSKV